MGRWLDSIEFDEYKAVLAKNKIDGKCLMKCSTVEDVKEMGISITVKADILLDKIRKWKAEVNLPIVSYVPLTFTHIIVLYSTSHLSICVHALMIGCSDNWGYVRSHVEWQASQTSI